jgi:hypothetical protein
MSTISIGNVEFNTYGSRPLHSATARQLEYDGANSRGSFFQVALCDLAVALSSVDVPVHSTVGWARTDRAFS